MFAYKGLQIILCATLVIAVFSGAAQAQNINKCVGADGKVTFSDRPCSNGKAVELVNKKRSFSKGAAIDVNAICKDVDQKDLKKASTCRVMQLCEQHQTPEICNFYCSDQMGGEFLPGSGIVAGPTSELCLSKAKRVRGTNWVETSERWFNSAENEYGVKYKCIDKNGKLGRDPSHVFCNADDTRCKLPLVNVKNPEFLTLDALVSKICMAEQR